MGFIPGAQEWFKIWKLINITYHINKTKDKSHVILSTHAGKASDKIQHPLKIKICNKVGIKGKYLNIIKPYMTNSWFISYSNGKKTKSFSSKIRNKTKMCTLTTYSTYIWKS